MRYRPVRSSPHLRLEFKLPKNLSLPVWPDGADVCVAFTFDVDAECSFLRMDEVVQYQLTLLSEARFGPVRGLPRILDLLRAEDVPGTFYIPGDTVERHTDAVELILGGRHEVGHHGYMHLHDDQMDAARQREEIERGLDAMQKRLGVTPRGYRSPGWELRPETVELLKENDFRYDSSCMGDDRPYIEQSGTHEVLEFPVHWSLDDVCFYRFTRQATMIPLGVLFDTWLAEFETALAERRMVTFTMHPEVIGRGYRIREFARLISAMRERANVWFATHSEVADLVQPTNDRAGPRVE